MFLIAKILSFLTSPLFWVLLTWFLGLVLLRYKPRLATVVLWSGWGLLILLGLRAVPDSFLRVLENRYPSPSDTVLSQSVGIILLEGGLDNPAIFQSHQQPSLNTAAERMTVAAALLREHPDWQLVFSGGVAQVLSKSVSEAAVAQAFFQEQGLDMSRIQFEGSARNTRENATQVAKLLEQNCQKSWLLVTSAYHLPRAMMEFDKTPCYVIPYPVDFRTADYTPWYEYSLSGGIERWEIVLHEWLGILAYKFGR